MILLVEHLLRSIALETHGIRKVALELRLLGSDPSLHSGVFQSILGISTPFDFEEYFPAPAEQRSAILAQATEDALCLVAEQRRWSKKTIHEIFDRVRAANYELHADRAKACRSPDGTKRARVSYHVDRSEFRIDVTVTGQKKKQLLHKTVYRDRPTAGLCVRFTLGKPSWSSNSRFVVPWSKPNNPDAKIVVRVPK